MIIRPSSAPLWSVCAGQPALAVPDDLDGDDTTARDGGIACHWAAEAGFATGDSGAMLGKTHANGVTADAEMVAACKTYMDVVYGWNSTGRAHIEQPVKCHGIHPWLEGTPDVFAWNPSTATLYLADLKYGFRIVMPDSPQLLCYIDGVVRFLGVTPRTVVTTIVQPRAPHRDGPVRTLTRTWEEVLPALQALTVAAHKATQPGALCTINPGCRNCSGRHRCDTLISAVGNMIDASTEATPHDLTFEQQEHQLRYTQDAINIMEAYATGLERQVEHAIRNGARSRYFSMRGGLTPLQWDTGSADKIRALAQLMGVTVDKAPDIITPTQAASVLGRSVVELYARRHSKSPKLTPDDPTIWAKKFNDN